MKPSKTKARKSPSSSAADGEETEAERKRNIARIATSPEFAAFRVLQIASASLGSDKPIDVVELIETLRDQAATVRGGDLTRVEAMLLNQATALQTVFVGLTERAFSALELKNLETFMRLALKAQSQCRATLETLATVKNPPLVIAKQANIAHQQQVNNNSVTEPSHAREMKTAPNELLERQHGERLDFRTTAAAGGVDSPLEAVGKIDGAENG